MVKKVVLVAIIIAAIILIGFLGWSYWNNLEYLDKIKHETDRWSVIMDSKNDIIAIETSETTVWDTMKNLHENQTEMWIGGIIEEYDNYWGFRFDPDTIVIAQITIEGAQSTLEAISEDLDYWMNNWTSQVYVFAKVTQVYE